MQIFFNYIPQEITSGLIIGIGAGITTSLILGARRQFIKYLDRREQIQYIRDLIETKIEQILSTKDYPPPTHNQKPYSANHARLAFYRELEDALQTSIIYRSTSLTYKEVFSLQKILTDVNRLLSPFETTGIFPHLIADEHFYQKLKNLNWLGLP